MQTNEETHVGDEAPIRAQTNGLSVVGQVIQQQRHQARRSIQQSRPGQTDSRENEQRQRTKVDPPTYCRHSLLHRRRAPSRGRPKQVGKQDEQDEAQANISGQSDLEQEKFDRRGDDDAHAVGKAFFCDEPLHHV